MRFAGVDANPYRQSWLRELPRATQVRAQDFTEGGAFWQVGVPEVSERSQVTAARARMDKGLKDQRTGV